MNLLLYIVLLMMLMEEYLVIGQRDVVFSDIRPGSVRQSAPKLDSEYICSSDNGPYCPILNDEIPPIVVLETRYRVKYERDEEQLDMAIDYVKFDNASTEDIVYIAMKELEARIATAESSTQDDGEMVPLEDEEDISSKLRVEQAPTENDRSSDELPATELDEVSPPCEDGTHCDDPPRQRRKVENTKVEKIAM